MNKLQLKKERLILNAFNIVKFFLGIISLIFDIIFFTQWYIIYRNPTNDLVEEWEEDVDNNKKSLFLSSSSQISSKERIS